MYKKILFSVGVLSTLIACQPKCETITPKGPKKIALSESSTQLQALFGNENSLARSLTVGNSIKNIKEVDSTFVSKSDFVILHQPDLSSDYWCNTEYYFDKENIINEITIDVNAFSEYEVDSIYYELTDYLDGRLGKHVTDPDYRKVWNDTSLSNGALAIVSVDYVFPQDDFFVSKNPDGTNDTIKNYPSIKYNVKLID